MTAHPAPEPRTSRTSRHRSRRLTAAAQAFLRVPYEATLTTVRSDNRLHVAPVRFTYDDKTGIARVLTVDGRIKVRNLTDPPAAATTPTPRAALCQSVGMRWISLEGPAVVSSDPVRISDAEHRHLERYHAPPPTPPGRVVIEIDVEQITTPLS